MEETWRFLEWEEDSGTGVVMESILPVVRLENGALRVVYVEPDGRALRTDTGAGLTQSVVGPHGLDIEGLTLGPVWKQNSLHGDERDARQEVMHFGTRYLALRDGLWLQPEPLLHLGLTNGDLRRPLAYSQLHAAGNRNYLADRTGRFAILLAFMQEAGEGARAQSRAGSSQTVSLVQQGALTGTTLGLGDQSTGGASSRTPSRSYTSSRGTEMLREESSSSPSVISTTNQPSLMRRRTSTRRSCWLTRTNSCKDAIRR